MALIFIFQINKSMQIVKNELHQESRIGCGNCLLLYAGNNEGVGVFGIGI
jgi:hypothetical protein